MVFVAVLLAGLGGCQQVVSDHLVGKLADEEVTRSLAGKWTIGEKVVEVGFKEEGVLTVKGLFDDESRRAWVTTDGGEIYVQVERPEESVAGQEGKERPPVLLCRVAVSAEYEHGFLVVYLPSGPTFQEAVEQGKLKGVVREEPVMGGMFDSPRGGKGAKQVTIWIQGDKGAWDRFVRPERAGEQFLIGAPLVLTRVK
jgi:hypothetical protein